MKAFHRSLLIATTVLFCFAADKPDFKTWVSPDHFDVKALLGDPPADDSAEHQAEVAKLLDLQAHRTPDEIARCKDEEEVTVFAFDTVLGKEFNKENLPKTAAFMKEVQKQTKAVSALCKKVWNRKRPAQENPAIKPCVKGEDSASYPSGHATRGIVWATVLSELYPDKKDDLMARGKQIGDDRLIAGMHWTSDVVAGQKLGAAVAQQLLKDEDFQTELAKVKEECLAVKR